MGLRIKLLRCGRKKRPYYRIVVGECVSGGKGKYLEKIGYYDSGVGNKLGKKYLLVNRKRLHYWLSKGAYGSNRVEKLVFSNYGAFKRNK